MSAKLIAQRFFRRFASAQVSIPKSSGNVYELFVYTLVCRAIDKAGHTVQFLSPATGKFPFRSSPGRVSNNWGYCAFPGKHGRYELRNGVEILGHSQMRHESDMAIFRVSPNYPNALGTQAELILTIECKHYATAAKLKAEARKNLGMVQDWSRTVHPSKRSSSPQGCIHCGLHFQPLFVTNVSSQLRPDIEGYLEAYDLEPCFGIAPYSQEASAFVVKLTQLLQVL